MTNLTKELSTATKEYLYSNAWCVCVRYSLDGGLCACVRARVCTRVCVCPVKRLTAS